MRLRGLLLIFIFALFGCSVTKRLPEGSYLLYDNELYVTYPDTLDDKLKISRSIIKEYIPANQRPNSKVLGYNLGVRIHQMANPNSESWGNRVLRRIGTPPVMYDSMANQAALENLKLYMESEGYYNSDVTDTVIYKDKRAFVYYNINASSPYTVSSYRYNFIDSTVMPYVLLESSNSLIDNGVILKRSILTDERLRISNMLQEKGFYYFSVSNIDYLVDTISSNADVTINIKQRTIDRVGYDHRRYRIGNITVEPVGTTYQYLRQRDTATVVSTVIDSITYLQPSSLESIKPRILSNMIKIKPYQVYSKEDVRKTRDKLNLVSLYRNVVVEMTELADTVENQELGVMDCKIQTVQELHQDFRVEFEASTNSNYTGFSMLLGYTNKNIFNGGETLNVDVTGGYDFMGNRSNSNSETSTNGDNVSGDSWELGGNVTVTFPRLLEPFNLSRLSSVSLISTQLEAVINTQRRPYYHKTTTTVAYGYKWNSIRTSYLLRPINISLISVPWRDEEYINDKFNEYLRASYDSQIVAGSTFSMVFNNRSEEYHKITVRANVETSGNLLSLLYSVANVPKELDSYGNSYNNLLNIRYSQYVRPDITFVYTNKLSDAITLAYRLTGGWGFSYGNSFALPIDRQFYAGGSSSMRGWQIKTLGPGNAPETTDIYPNQLGNIKLETNIEMRFPIYDVMKGALFFDLGNIWSDSEGAEAEEKLSLNSIHKQLAFNTGLGVRLDFDFFVLRVDWGIQLYNPGKPADERWVIKNFNFKNSALHFGIGYPF